MDTIMTTQQTPLTPPQRHRRARELRAQGWTYQRIADELGYAGASAARYACQLARRTVDSRRAEARALRDAGWTYRQIAETMGYKSYHYVYKLLRRGDQAERLP